MSHEEQVNNPRYRNWVKAGLAFKYGKDAIKPFVTGQIIIFRDDVLRYCPNKYCNQCSITNLQKAKPTPCPSGLCNNLFDEIKKANICKQTMWQNTDSTKWSENSWTIAQCFMPKGYEGSTTFDKTDFTGILSVVINAKFMKPALKKSATDIFERLKITRNTVIHSGELEIDDKTLKIVLDRINTMVIDTYVQIQDKDVKEACDLLVKLKEDKLIVTTADTFDVCKDALRHIKLLSDDIDEAKIQISMLNEKIHDHSNETIPRNMKDQHELEIQSWQTEDEDFVKRRASTYLTRQLEKSNPCVIIIGEAGSGKSTVVKHEALRLKDIYGFELVPISDPSEIISYYNKDIDQVFVSDDCFGPIYLNATLVDHWDTYLNKLKLIIVSNTKGKMCKHILLISSRVDIYKEAETKTHTLSSLETLVCDLTSEELSLSYEEKVLLLRMYIPELEDPYRTWDTHEYVHVVANQWVVGVDGEVDPILDISYLDLSHPYFPLLCRLSRGQDCKAVMDIFKTPMDDIARDIKLLQNKHPLKFCCICICVLFNNTFEDHWLIDYDSIPDRHKTALEEVFDEFDLKLSRERDRNKILMNLHALEKSYTEHVDGKLRIAHWSLYSQCIKSCAQNLTEIFIKYSDFDLFARIFIMEGMGVDSCSLKRRHNTGRVLLTGNENIVVETSDQLVVLPQNRLKLFLERIKAIIIEKGLHRIYVLEQFKSKTFRRVFVKMCRNDMPTREGIKRHAIQNELQKGKQHMHNQMVFSGDSDEPFNLFEYPSEMEYLSIVKLLADFGCSPNTLTKQQRNTALHVSIIKGNLNIVKVLLSANADVNTPNRRGETPLHVACKCLNSAVPLLLDKGSNIDFQNLRGASPLFWACRKVNTDLLQLLIKRGADVNICDIKHKNALMWACRSLQRKLKYEMKPHSHYKINKSAFLILVKTGIDLNNCDYKGRTALMWVCFNGQSSLAKCLIEHGANVNIPDMEIRSAINYACVNGNVDTVRVLFENGALYNPGFGLNIPAQWEEPVGCRQKRWIKCKRLQLSGFDQNGNDIICKTSLLWCCEKKYKTLAALLINVQKCAKDGDIRDRKGKTSLIWACENGHSKLVSLLLKHESKMNSSDIEGKSPLIWACQGGHTKTAEILLKEGVDPNHFDNENKTPLMWASQFGKIRSAKVLLKYGANINVRDCYGKTAFMWACDKGDRYISEYLLNNGTDVNKGDINGTTGMMWACHAGYLKVVKCILDNGIDLETFDKKGKTALMYASQSGYIQTTTLLLETNANINSIDKTGKTAIMLACFQPQKPSGLTQPLTTRTKKMCPELQPNDIKANIVLHEKQSFIKSFQTTFSLLLDRGADVNTKDKKGGTALMYACKRGYSQTVSTLLGQCHDINAQDKTGNTALVWACFKGHRQIASMLLVRGADANLRNGKGKTALMRACENGYTHTVCVLLEQGADVNVCDNKGNTGLIWSSYCGIGREGAYFSKPGSTNIVRLLMEYGADVNIPNVYGVTAFMRACEKGRLHIASLLFSENTDINDKDFKGNTALMRACAALNYVRIDWFLERGADVNARNKQGWSALMWACNGKSDSSSLLSNHADASISDIYGVTPLMLAAKRGALYNVRELLAKNVCVDACDHKGNTALMWSCDDTTEHLDVVMYLLQKGASVNVFGDAGKTSLMKACEMGFTKTVNLLLERGADINAIDNLGNTPLLWTFGGAKEHVGIVSILLKKGCYVNVRNTKGETVHHLASMKGYKQSLTTIAMFIVFNDDDDDEFVSNEDYYSTDYDYGSD